MSTQGTQQLVSCDEQTEIWKCTYRDSRNANTIIRPGAPCILPSEKLDFLLQSQLLYCILDIDEKHAWRV